VLYQSETQIPHYRSVRRVAVVVSLTIATLSFISLGVAPLNTALAADHSLSHGGFPACNGMLPGGSVVGIASTADDGGYWIVNNQGLVVACGDAQNFGGLTSPPNKPIVGMAATPDGGGYYLVASDGGVFTFGDAVFQGSTGAMRLNEPVVGMAVDPTTGGYWLVASDGGIFSFKAPFYGSAGSLTLKNAVVGMAPDVGTGGYWLVASDGGIFAFNAPFQGSMGLETLNKPIVGMAPDAATGGYWLVAADGGIFSFGAPFHGSAGSLLLNRPIVGMAAAGTGSGYRFVASDGGIFDFGSSGFFGSAAASSSVAILAGSTATPPTTTSPPTTTTQPPTPTTTTAPPPAGTTTPVTTAPEVVTVSLFNDGAMGCDFPATPGCPLDVEFTASGFAPTTSYPVTVSGPGDTTSNGGPTSVTTDSEGDVGTAVDVGATNLPALTGTYTVTFGGVSGSYAYTAPKYVSVVLYDSAPGCGAPGSTGCPLDIDMTASGGGFAPNATYLATAYVNGVAAGSAQVSTDANGDVGYGGQNLLSPVAVGETPSIPFTGPEDFIVTVSFDGVTGTDDLNQNPFWGQS
jgi:hypothetical protein